MARALVAVFIAIALCCGSAGLAQAGVPLLNQPAWSELTPDQRAALSPLAGEWAGMENFRRKKWLGVAQRYPTMSPQEQARIQLRMKEWAKLSPEQRKLARENYKSLKQVSADHKEAIKQKWEEYSQLPESEKAKLKAEAAHKPPVKHVPATSLRRPLQQAAHPSSPLLAPVAPAAPINPVIPLSNAPATGNN